MRRAARAERPNGGGGGAGHAGVRWRGRGFRRGRARGSRRGHRAGATVADGQAVDLDDGGDEGGGGGDEGFRRALRLGEGEGALLDADLRLAAVGDDGGAGDAVQDGVGEVAVTTLPSRVTIQALLEVPSVTKPSSTSQASSLPAFRAIILHRDGARSCTVLRRAAPSGCRACR